MAGDGKHGSDAQIVCDISCGLFRDKEEGGVENPRQNEDSRIDQAAFLPGSRLDISQEKKEKDGNIFQVVSENMIGGSHDRMIEIRRIRLGEECGVFLISKRLRLQSDETLHDRSRK